MVRDANGAVFNHDFSVWVREQPPENRPPVFISIPPTNATARAVYTYLLRATDPDGDDVTFAAVVMPTGASLTNVLISGITWTPTDDQGGRGHTFVIDASDGNGGTTRQQWVVQTGEFVPPNTPPRFTTAPSTQAQAGVVWSYTARWEDAEGHAVTFRMVSGPSGMQAAADGQVRWNPDENQAGRTHRAIFEVRDSEGASSRQTVDIEVAEPDPENRPPVITTEAPTEANVAQPYRYQPAATDPDGDAVTFVLTVAPAGARLIGGAVLWIPSQRDGGEGHNFSLRASDGNGGTATQSWVVQVGAVVGNRAPSITSQPVTQATVGEVYTYQVTATDPDGDTLFFLLPQDQNPPAGMQIDSRTGVIRWTPGQDVAGERVRVAVAVADPDGLFDAQVYEIGVGVPANQPPRIISSAPVDAQVNVQYVYQVVARDPEGETLRFFTDPDRCPSGASIHVLNGRFTWTPGQGDAGNRVSCVIGTVDPGDLMDLQTITIQVAGEAVNLDPQITSQPPTTATEGSPYAYNIVASDANGDDLIYTVVSSPRGARLIQQGPLHIVVWQVPAGSNGQSFRFEIRVSDGNGGVAGQSWNVLVGDGEPNQPPIITSSPPITGAPGVVYNYRVTAFDLERELLTYTLDQAPGGAVINQTSGNITWTPTEGQGGQAHSFRLLVTDPRGGVARQNWSAQITGDPPPPINRPPVITSLPVVEASVGELYTYRVVASDEDGDILFWVLPEDQNPPTGMEINATTGVISWTPDETFGQQRVAVVVAVTDGTAWAAQRYEISVDAGDANLPPTFTTQPPTQATAGEQLVYQAAGTDPEGGTIRFFLLDDACAQGMTINTVTGQFLWTPGLGLIGSTMQCVIGVRDEAGLANTQALAITVTDGSLANRAPTITSTPLEVAVVDQPYRYSARATDPDDDPLGWVMTAGPRGAFLNAGTGVLTWTPTEDDLGIVAFAVEVRDGRGGVNRQQWDVTVDLGNPNNQPPVFTSQPGNEARVGQAYGYAASARDPDDDELSWRLLESPSGAQVNAETGAVGWIPTAQFENRVVVFQLQVSDGTATVRQRWTVRVEPQIGGNNPPSITSAPPTQVFLGDELSTRIAATDADGDELVWRLVAAPPRTSLTSAGELSWSPQLADLGRTYGFSAEVSDGRGGTDRISWDVTVPNRAPEITSSAVTEATVGEAYRYQVAASDEDIGQPLRYSIASGTPAGMQIDPNRGLISWIPAGSQGGQSYFIVVRVEDSLGERDEQSFQLGVEVPIENTAPAISGRAPATATAGELYSHDFEARDAEGDALLWTLEPGAPAAMTIDRGTGVLRWNVPLSMVGRTIQFIVKVTDPGGLFDRQTTLVLVEVVANANPEFGAEPPTTGVVGEAYVFAPRVSDEDGDPIEVEARRLPPGARCSDGACNSLTWTPASAGTFAFHLIATDDRGGSAELQWNVVVTDPSPNARPVFSSTPVTRAAVGEEYTYRATARDADGDDLAYSLSPISPSQMDIDAATGEILWTPTEDDVGTHTVVVQVSDGRGGSDLQSYQLEVVDEDVNRPPVVTSEPLTEALPTQLYEYRIRAYDPDEDDTLTFTLKRGPGGMEVSDNGTVTWTPGVEAIGQAAMVQVEISDGDASVLHEWVVTVIDDGSLDPTADAGPDRTVDPGRIELDGSASQDPLARRLTYLWELLDGPDPAAVDDPSLQIATIELLYPGDYTFKLTVTVADGRTDSDDVVITVNYTGPIAIAGDDQRVELPADGEPVRVQLSGAAVVLEETAPVYAWSQLSGPEATLEAADTANPFFKVVDPGVYTFDLVVSDDELTSEPDTVVISVVRAESGGAGNWGVDEEVCGCAGSPLGDAAWLLFVLPALRRRRRCA
jgi:hypothetical protein